MSENNGHMVLVDRAAFIGRAKVKIHRFLVPSMDCVIFLRSLSGSERSKLGEKYKRNDKAELDEQARKIVYPALVQSVVTEDGERVFTDADAELMGDWDGKLLDEITNELMRISGLSKDAVGEAEKNSKTTPSAVSTSD